MANRANVTGGVGRGKAARHAVCAGLLVALVGLAGCDIQSYMDPSVVGRWQETPIKSPIIDTIVTIEGQGVAGIETSKVRPEDLMVDIQAYRVGPGDVIDLTVQDFMISGSEQKFEGLEVDSRGYVDLPAVPSVFVYGQTVDQIKDSVTRVLAEAKILTKPVLNVVIRSRRKLTYTIIGNVNAPGLYSITKPDFRLMDALGQAGRFAEGGDKVFVIRQIPLSDRVTSRPPDITPPSSGGSSPTSPPSHTPDPGGKKPNVVDIIDDITKPGQPKPSPALMRDDPPRKPAIDIIEPGTPAKPGTKAAATPAASSAPAQPGHTTWVFSNGQWVQSSRGAAVPSGAGTSGAGATPGAGTTPGLPVPPSVPMTDAGTEPGRTTPTAAGENPGEDLMTQRVIEIPLQPLLAGAAQFNIVIRPGDIVRVPTTNEGVFYMAGQVARPGPYTLPISGKMTLMRSIDAAGGLSSLAIPERVDLTRIVGPDAQVTMRVNLRAIVEGTHPDIILKADDRVNVGTNFFAFPLAVIRNGLRASYGFGFIVDRNFGYDVFGPQQTNAPGF